MIAWLLQLPSRASVPNLSTFESGVVEERCVQADQRALTHGLGTFGGLWRHIADFACGEQTLSDIATGIVSLQKEPAVARLCGCPAVPGIRNEQDRVARAGRQ